MKRTRKTVKSIEQMFDVCKELKLQGWVERPFSKALPMPIKNATEKIILYVWKWHGTWTSPQKEYCTTFYR